MFRKLGLSVALAAALLAGSSTARAEDALAKAKALFDIGAKQYDAGQYKQAIRSFEEAYALSKRPGLLFSLGQAHKKQYFFDRDPVHLKAAIESYRQYLKGDAPRKGEASAAIKELEPYELKALAASGCVPCVGPQTPPKPGDKPPGDKPPGDKPPGDKPPGQPPGPEPQGGAQLSIACEVDGATVVIDGGQPIPLPTQVEVTPGKHKLKIQALGYEDYEREVNATGGIAPVIADLEPKPARLHIDAAAGAEILVDGKVVTKTPMKGAALIPPGRHVVSVLASGHYGWNEEIVLGKDEEKKVKIQLKTTAQRYAAWGIGAGGLASLAVGAVFTGLALVQENKAQQFIDVQQKAGNASVQQLREYQEALDARRDFAAGAVIGYGVAGVALVSSLVLLTTDKPGATLPAFKLEEPKEKRPKGEKMEMGMLPIVTPTFGGLGLVGKF